ncbi:hypothetical protein IFR09_27155 [Pseudomonas syringae]|nr:hypothetical protein [Pseudomonas syringae]MBD8573856.1 hypothetical protein [Pseudomonas syringae]MBD8790178.1 hypothetical protein [Pseudomonas syringae]MBD8803820.1 hypothetical protein [Pseudomonas syringae]MBD8814847.1 hypothetical protein [Pseudomonas syringae]
MQNEKAAVNQYVVIIFYHYILADMAQDRRGDAPPWPGVAGVMLKAISAKR